jgi:uncharacterized membrane protein
MFPFSKKKKLLSTEEDKIVLEAIRQAEALTSGEIRVYMESRNPLMDTLERAAVIFRQLEMEKTHHRNGVLIYLAIKDRELAIFADQGIHEQVGSDYWKKEIAIMLEHFKKHEPAKGLVHCIHDIGKVLQEKFPYIPGEDKNELPDEIIFGH